MRASLLLLAAASTWRCADPRPAAARCEGCSTPAGDADRPPGESEQPGDSSPLAHAFARLVAEVAALPTAAARQQAVDAFLAQDGVTLPFVDGDEAVIAYQDAGGELGTQVDAIFAAGDLNDWVTNGTSALMRLADTDLVYLWYYGLPAAARIDYKLVFLERDGALRWSVDPRNPNRSPGVGGDNSELRMPLYVPSPYLAHRPEVPHGWVGELTADLPSADPHQLFVYFPPGHLEGAGPYPGLIVNDGGEYKDKALLANVLDNLLAEGLLPGIVVMFVVPNDRDREYFGDCLTPCPTGIRDYLRYLTEDLLPFAAASWKVSTEPAQVGILGASYGGHIALRAASSHPDRVGLVAAQSARVDAPYNGEFPAVLDEYAVAPPMPLRIYLDTGTINDLYEDDRAFYDVLVAAGYAEVSFAAYDEGHAWGNWRARLDDLLLFLFAN